MTNTEREVFTEQEQEAFRLAEGMTLSRIRDEGGILRRDRTNDPPEGDVRRMLFRIAVNCLERDLQVDGILSGWNQRLPQDLRLSTSDVMDVLELAHVFRNRCRQDLSEEPPGEDMHEALNLTDAGNSERLVRCFENQIKYCHEMRNWYIWTGKYWKQDVLLGIDGLAVQTARKIYEEATETDNLERRQAIAKWAVRSESLGARKAMVTGARHMVAVSANAFDAHPNLFNCQNGTLDLETGEFRGHRKEDMLTKISGVEYKPGATCPMWLDHLETVFQGDVELIDSFQMLMGYNLLQRNPEQIMSIWYGTGKNGKSETMRAIGMILGDYWVHIQAETLVVSRGGGGTARPDILRLKGARFVTCTEPEQDAALAEALVKSITGDAKMAARPLYGEVVEFEPGCKIVLATNHLPQIKGTDYGIWRRIWPIPFTATIPEAKRRPEYGTTLFREEGNGIFNWMLDGLRRYQKAGNLERPEAVQKAFQAYRLQANPIGAYLEDCCEIVEGERASKTDIYAAYRDWCSDLGQRPLSSIAFGKIMKTLFQEGRDVRVRYWEGIRLKPEGADDYPDTGRFTFRVRAVGEEGRSA
jgi:putative DNA primase/helicase